jgi:hypothetical protein
VVAGEKESPTAAAAAPRRLGLKQVVVGMDGPDSQVVAKLLVFDGKLVGAVAWLSCVGMEWLQLTTAMLNSAMVADILASVVGE